MMPSSVHSTCTGRSSRARRSSIASAHGAWTRAERGEDADAPVADLVGEALDDDRAVVGHRAGRLGLLVEVGAQVRSRAGVEPVFAQARFGIGAGELAQLTRERAERAAELERPAGPVALPERGLGGLAGRGRDDHAVEGDLLDPPRGRAEHEALADAALVHHLLVELADRAPSGRNTPKRPRSGIVPPLAIAIRCAPSRARTRCCTRSHTTRGRRPEN